MIFEGETCIVVKFFCKVLLKLCRKACLSYKTCIIAFQSYSPKLNFLPKYIRKPNAITSFNLKAFLKLPGKLSFIVFKSNVLVLKHLLTRVIICKRFTLTCYNILKLIL